MHDRVDMVRQSQQITVTPDHRCPDFEGLQQPLKYYGKRYEIRETKITPA